MILEETTNYQLIKQIYHDPKLYFAHHGFEKPVNPEDPKTSNKYLLIKENDKIFGMFQVREMTGILLEAHIYLLPAYWGKNNYSLSALKSLTEYFKKTNYHKLITDTPQCCKHVIKLLKKIKATQCGYIENGVIYNNKLMGLLLFSLDLKRD